MLYWIIACLSFSQRRYTESVYLWFSPRQAAPCICSSDPVFFYVKYRSRLAVPVYLSLVASACSRGPHACNNLCVPTTSFTALLGLDIQGPQLPSCVGGCFRQLVDYFHHTQGPVAHSTPGFPVALLPLHVTVPMKYAVRVSTVFFLMGLAPKMTHACIGRRQALDAGMSWTPGGRHAGIHWMQKCPGCRHALDACMQWMQACKHVLDAWMQAYRHAPNAGMHRLQVCTKRMHIHICLYHLKWHLHVCMQACIRNKRDCVDCTRACIPAARAHKTHFLHRAE